MSSRNSITANVPTGGRVLRWFRNLLLGLVAVVTILAAAGFIYQAIGSRANANPAPGQLHMVRGRTMHINCTGQGTHTILLETMSGGTSANWGWIQPELARNYRVCSYDRAGRGWSTPFVEANDLWGTASDLAALLDRAGEVGPYVLVGHSLGGLYVRAFAQEHGQEVAGVVLLDSSHPDLFDRHPEYIRSNDEYLEFARYFPTIARFGLFRLFFATGGQIDFEGLPAEQHDQVAEFWSSPDFHRSQVSESRAALAIMRQAQQLDDLGDMPLLVISAADNPESWYVAQHELMALSSSSRHFTLPGTTHVSLAFDREHAAQVSELIATFVRAGAHWPR